MYGKIDRIFTIKNKLFQSEKKNPGLLSNFEFHINSIAKSDNNLYQNE